MNLIKQLIDDKIYYTKLKMGKLDKEMLSVLRSNEPICLSDDMMNTLAEYSVSVLTMVISKAKEIARENKLEKPTDEMVYEAIRKELKELEQTKKACEESHRDELLTETVAKIYLITEYLPTQLTAEELEIKIQEILSSMEDTSNRGLVMKSVMAECKNIADGKLINSTVSKLLNK